MDPFYYPHYQKIKDNIYSVTVPSTNDSLGTMSSLPTEVLGLIFEKLDAPSLFGASKVCRTFAVLSAKNLEDKLSGMSPIHLNLISEKISQSGCVRRDSDNFHFERSFNARERNIIEYRLFEEGSKMPPKDGSRPPGFYNPQIYLNYPRDEDREENPLDALRKLDFNTKPEKKVSDEFKYMKYLPKETKNQIHSKLIEILKERIKSDELYKPRVDFHVKYDESKIMEALKFEKFEAKPKPDIMTLIANFVKNLKDPKEVAKEEKIKNKEKQ